MNRSVAATLLAGLLALFVPLAPANAHESLLTSSPAEGSTVKTLPASVTLTFSGAMASPAYVVVTAPDGTAMAAGDAVIADNTVIQALETEAPAGTYQVAYRAVSADGHQMTGQFAFEVANGTASPEPTPSEQPSTPAEEPAPAATESTESDESDGATWQWWIGGGLVVAAGALWLASRRDPHRST